MFQIRVGVFETNSSSTHSITMCMKSDFQKWKDGEVFYAGEYSYFTDKSFVSKDELQKCLRDCGCDDVPDDTEELVKTARDYDLRVETYEDFFFYNEFEIFSEDFKTPNGEEVVAFGYYGNNY